MKTGILTTNIKNVRMCEYIWVSVLTGKKVKMDNDSAIKEHHLFWNHLVLIIFPD